VQHIEQVFRREVARRAWRKRAAAQPARAGVENIHALLQRGQHIRQRRAVGVVEVVGEALQRQNRQQRLGQAGDLGGHSRADGVAQAHLVDAHRQQAFHDRCDSFGGNHAFVGAHKRGGHIPARPAACRLRLAHDLRELLQRLLDATVQVALAEGLGGGGEHGDFACACR
jgi:hypothetical protein